MENHHSFLSNLTSTPYFFDVMEPTHFDSALSSLVSSPSHASGNGGVDSSSAVLGDLIGRLGSICNSGEMSCYSTPLHSPHGPIPPSSCFGNQFAELPGRLSRVSSSKSLGNHPPQDSPQPAKCGSSNTSRKRKGPVKGKAKEAILAVEDDGSGAKRSKLVMVNGGEEDEEVEKAAAAKFKAQEPPKDYIHVRARRGQATDSHSLAERVRRERISERMKLLQSLVPGCNKVTGKALMLDEIINYVQSLQRQVEFLSMKLANMNPQIDIGEDHSLPKDMQQGAAIALPLPVYVAASAAISYCQQPQVMHLQNSTVTGFEGYPQFGVAIAEDDLQSVVQMGFRQAHEYNAAM